MGRDPKSALGWIFDLPEQAVRESLLAVGAKAIAATDPDLAADWLVTAVKSKATLNETIPCIVAAWAAQSPAQAAAWVARFSPEATREASAAIVLHHWFKINAATAETWLIRQPDRANILARLKPPDEISQPD